MDSRSKSIPQVELNGPCPTRPVEETEPLPGDRWLASSVLQKAIRRGDVLIAQRAVRTLYRHDPRSAWHRLVIIAFEDVGIGALGAVSVTTRSAPTPTPAANSEETKRPRWRHLRCSPSPPKTGAPTCCSPPCCMI